MFSADIFHSICWLHTDIDRGTHNIHFSSFHVIFNALFQMKLKWTYSFKYFIKILFFSLFYEVVLCVCAFKYILLLSSLCFSLVFFFYFPNFSIYTVLEELRGTIWIGFLPGLCFYFTYMDIYIVTSWIKLFR